MKIYKYNKKKDNRGYFSKLLSVKNKKLIGKNILEVILSYNKKRVLFVVCIIKLVILKKQKLFMF